MLRLDDFASVLYSKLTKRIKRFRNTFCRKIVFHFFVFSFSSRSILIFPIQSVLLSPRDSHRRVNFACKFQLKSSLFCNVSTYEKGILIPSIVRKSNFGFNSMWEKVINKSATIMSAYSNWENSLYCQFIKSFWDDDRKEKESEAKRWRSINAYHCNVRYQRRSLKSVA